MIKANQTLINRLNMILDLLLLSGSYIANRYTYRRFPMRLSC